MAESRSLEFCIRKEQLPKFYFNIAFIPVGQYFDSWDTI